MKRKIQDSQDIEMLENIRLLMGISDRVLKYIDNISDDYFFSDERAKEKFYKNFTKRKINQKLEEKQPKNDEPIQIILDDSRPINYFDEGQSHFQQVYDSSKDPERIFSFREDVRDESNNSENSRDFRETRNYFDNQWKFQQLTPTKSSRTSPFLSKASLSESKQNEESLNSTSKETGQEMLESSTEIDRYLQKNYIKVNTDELMTQLKNSEIKSYALKFKVTELEKAFRFICPRWSIFQKIWIVLDKNEREISLLFKNKLFGKKEFFCKNFRNKFYEFYILKNGRKIPKTEIEFFGAFQESKIYSLLRKTKTKQDFIKNVDRFETWIKNQGFEDSIETSLKYGIKMKITDSMNESSNQEGVENEGQSNSIKEQNLGEEEEKGSEMEIDVVIESSSPNNDESSAH